MTDGDVLDWLIKERDRHAELRTKGLNSDDWSTVQQHDDASNNLYRAIQEISKGRERIKALEEVLVRRVLVAAKDT